MASGDLLSFSQFLATHEEGALNAFLTDAQQELVNEMTAHGANGNGKAKGKIIITLDYALEDGVIEVTADPKITKPKPRRGRGVYWPGKNGALSTSNPKQQELPLRDVTASHELRTI